MPALDAKDLAGHHVFTRNIQAAAALIAIGARLRPQLPVTATRAKDRPEDVIFWFENGEIECGGVKRTAAAWLGLFTCPWSDFDLGLEHPAAFLKAAGENRTILVQAVKSAQSRPFRVVQRGNRIAVLGPDMSEGNFRRILSA